MKCSSIRFALRALGLAALVLMLGNSPALAEIFLNINFDAQNDGEAVATDTATTPFPLTKPYSTEGEPDTLPYTGTNTVDSSHGLSKSNLMTTTQGGTGSNQMDTQFLVSNNIVTLDFDLNVVATPATGIPQDTASAPNGQAFAINTFDLSSDRIWRFAVSPDSATAGHFYMRNNTDGDLISFGSYNTGEVHHLSIAANFGTNTVNVSLDNVVALTTLPFVTASPTNGGVSEFFFFQNGVEGQTNSIAIDNIVGTAVPEPSTYVLLGLGLVGVAIFRRRSALSRV